MAFTNADFVQKVLETVGRLATGQTVENDDSEYILAQMRAAFALLAETDTYPIPADDAFQDAEFLPLVDYVACRCGKYGRATIRGEPLKDIKRAAESDLRALNRQPQAKKTLSHDMFGRRGAVPFNWTTGV